MDGVSCGTSLDHAVAAVGYDSEDGKDYFIIRNSWSTDWGEAGYIRLAADRTTTGKGVCGVLMDGSWPTTD